MNKQNLFEKCFKDKKGRVVLLQTPNQPIIFWVVATLANRLIDGTAGGLMGVVAFGAIFTWAYLELFEGVNYFRRTLGLIVIILSVMNQLN